MNRTAHYLVAFALLMLATAVVFLALARVLPVAALVYAEYADARQPPCARLPSAAEVQRVVATNQATWEQIKQHSVSVSVNSQRCPGKAQIDIHYATADDRAAIERMIGDTFFGVPYRMVNV